MCVKARIRIRIQIGGKFPDPDPIPNTMCFGSTTLLSTIPLPGKDLSFGLASLQGCLHYVLTAARWFCKGHGWLAGWKMSVVHHPLLLYLNHPFAIGWQSSRPWHPLLHIYSTLSHSGQTFQANLVPTVWKKRQKTHQINDFQISRLSTLNEWQAFGIPQASLTPAALWLW